MIEVRANDKLVQVRSLFVEGVVMFSEIESRGLLGFFPRIVCILTLSSLFSQRINPVSRHSGSSCQVWQKEDQVCHPNKEIDHSLQSLRRSNLPQSIGPAAGFPAVTTYSIANETSRRWKRTTIIISFESFLFLLLLPRPLCFIYALQ